MRAFASCSMGILLAVCVTGAFMGCVTAPRASKEAAFVDSAKATTAWFEQSVPGLSEQINGSGGFVVFPDVMKWGTGIGGGARGRGVVCNPDGTQTGWAAINTASAGLQAGIEGFKALVVLRDKDALDQFKNGQLTGSVSGVFVAADKGANAVAAFDQGAAVYVGANKGLFAGVNLGLNLIRYEPLEAGQAPHDLR